MSVEKKRLSSYGSVEQSGKGFVNAGLDIAAGNNDASGVPAPPTDNPTNPFLQAKPTNPFASAD